MQNNEAYIKTIALAKDTLEKMFTNFQPTVAVILGSGLGGFSKHISQAQNISFSGVPGFSGSEVPGHASQIIYGSIGDVRVLVFSGRMHGYEGNDLRTVTLPVRLAGVCGAKHLILTNAAGGIADAFSPGDFMLITDQINFTGQNVLVGPNLSDFGPRFNDMSDPFDLAHRRTFLSVAKQKDVLVHEGVYIGVPGSSFETKAEIRAFKLWGASAVGMSTVHEVIAARHHNLRVMGVSMISNKAAGLSPNPISHQEVLEITKSKGHLLADLLRDWILNQEDALK